MICSEDASTDASGELLGVGGLDIHNEMVLLLDGERYSHQSQAFPLRDIPFRRMTLEQWIRQHPKTLIYAEPDELME